VKVVFWKSSEKDGKSFWSAKRIVSIFLLLFGIIAGMLLQHYYLEPLLTNDCVDSLGICKAQVSALDEENTTCFQQVFDLNRMLNLCNYDLQRYMETA